MEKRKTPFPGAVLAKKKDETKEWTLTTPAKLCAQENATLRNAESAFPFLTAHRKQTVLTVSDGSVYKILGMRVYCGKLMIVAQNGQYLEFYVNENGTLTKYFTSIEQYPYDYELDSYMHVPLFTSDYAQDLPSGASADKLLFFPIGKCMILSGGLPSTVLPLPQSVPALEHATVAGGRLYGTIGQKLYVSSGRSVFDFTLDAQGESDPLNGFVMPTTSFTEQKTPVTALKNYRGNVLIFRENAIQRVVGSANPFAVREMAQVGTKFGRSVCELDGSLYFICDGAPMRLTGSGVFRLPPLREGFKATGGAAVWQGKYWFTCEKDGTSRLMSYDPLCDGYGETTVSGNALDLCCADKLYMLCDAHGVKTVYAFGSDSVDTGFVAEFPVFEKEPAPKRLRSVSLHLYLGSGAVATLKAKRKNDAGQNTTATLGSILGNGRECVMRYRGNLPAAALLSLRIEGSGSVTVKGVYARASCAGQKRC